jgi:lysophospholipid acyltransferase (LPLAT)-like uncharacterized protein
MAYRVDDLPRPLRPLLAVFGWWAGALLLGVWAVLRLTVRVRHEGRPTTQSIQCAWHEGLLPYFVACLPYREPEVWLNHPLWVMKPIHVFLRWMGVGQLVLGSSGHGGRRALDELAPLVASGASTFLNPDGPAGPAHVVKDGVLDLGLKTGVPVVALRLQCSAAWRLPTWDRKLVPWPGSTIEVRYSPPRTVTEANRDEVRATLKAFMDGAPAVVKTQPPA